MKDSPALQFLALVAMTGMVGGVLLLMFWPRSIAPESDPRCDGPARYDANREAYEAGRPQPC